MSKRFDVRIPDEIVIEMLNRFIDEKDEEKKYIKGKWTQKIIKIGLMVCGCPELQNDSESNELLNTYINSGKYAHTNNINMIKAIDTTPINKTSKASKLTTKKDRAYYVLNYLKSVYLQEFTFREYVDKSKELLDRANDNRTIASNIELLEKDGAIAWVYDRYTYDSIIGEDGEIDSNKRKLTMKQRFKFTYNTQLVKENPYYLKDKSILKCTDAIKRYVVNRGETNDTEINEFAEINGFKKRNVWIGINILMYQGVLNLTMVSCKGINIYDVTVEAGE